MARRNRTDMDSRTAPRFKLPAMYTLIRVRPVGDDRYAWTGHIYDLSATGMRFELDSAIEPGTEVEIRAMLPGSEHTTIHAAGRIVRLHGDADEPGPMRMGLTFNRFPRRTDRLKLENYIERCHHQIAA